MKLTKPVHLSLIVIATLVLLWNLKFESYPRQIDGDSAFRALVWTKYATGLIKILGYYLAFSIVVLGHAICSRNQQPKAEQLLPH
jgi:hypothetical protein